MDNQIKDFYFNIPSNELPAIQEVLNGDFNFIENTHNWVQLAFPNFEPSECVSGAPVLNKNILNWLRTTQMNKIHKLIFKYMDHYSKLNDLQFAHNNRRVTRLIKFMVMLECPEYMINSVVSFFVKCSCSRVAQFEMNFDHYQYWNNAKNYKIPVID